MPMSDVMHVRITHVHQVYDRGKGQRNARGSAKAMIGSLIVEDHHNAGGVTIILLVRVPLAKLDRSSVNNSTYLLAPKPNTLGVTHSTPNVKIFDSSEWSWPFLPEPSRGSGSISRTCEVREISCMKRASSARRRMTTARRKRAQIRQLQRHKKRV